MTTDSDWSDRLDPSRRSSTLPKPPPVEILHTALMRQSIKPTTFHCLILQKKEAFPSFSLCNNLQLPRFINYRTDRTILGWRGDQSLVRPDPPPPPRPLPRHVLTGSLQSDHPPPLRQRPRTATAIARAS